MPKPKKSHLNLIYLIIALFALRWTVVEPYVVPTPSMEPTLKPGDRLYALKCAYTINFPFTNWVLFQIRKVKRGDVILFIPPDKPSLTYVKRAVAVEGDEIEFRNGELWVNGERIEKTPALDRSIMYDVENQENKTLYVENLNGVKHWTVLDNSMPIYRTIAPIRVPKGHVFASGDNRDHSSDSREWGFVPLENLKGQAIFIWYSFWAPALKDWINPYDTFGAKVMKFFVGSIKAISDWFMGQADIREERVGTLIQ